VLDCLLILEHNNEEITESSLRLCTRLQRFPKWSELRTAVLILGTCQPQYLKTLGDYGIGQVYQVGGDAYGLKNWLQVVSHFIIEQEVPLVILPGTVAGHELAPSLAVQLNAGVVTDCLELSVKDGHLEAIVQAYNGQYQLINEFMGQYNIVLMADLDPGTLEPMTVKECALTILSIPDDGEAVTVNKARETVQVLETYYLPPSELDIGEAEVIVGIGRGVETQEDLEQVQKLALALGAALAGSRPTVDAGLIPFARQIGQTGRLVNPQIYLSLGISGAAQHISGVVRAKIIAINNDPQAPILRLADLGVHGDWREIVPLLTPRMQEIKEERR